ncbi:3TM-type holin [Tabrizicola fusiformis]|uniref:3TM-type holin n=1 Tax=Tabrizicola sp. SY72 TaxID=2741673 RepID=UPI001F50E0A4|nr:3TM-type holin [Tabrizicola sp. SY72]
MSIAAMAAQIGTPIIAKILNDQLGGYGGLAVDVLQAVAKAAGVAVEDLDALAIDSPPKAVDALRVVERQSPELVALYAAGLEYQTAALQAEQSDPLWQRAWRPAGMYLIGLMWFWNIVALHVANAVWKIALPQTPYDVLIQLTGIYAGLYMGGHTIKDLAEKWKEKT